VRVPNPRLLLACPEDPDLSVNCSARTVSAFCDETGQEKCDWINVPYKINVGSVEVSIPVGNTEHSSLVVAVTTITTCGATIYLIITLFRQVKPKSD